MEHYSEMYSALLGAVIGGLFTLAGTLIAAHIAHRRSDTELLKAYKHILEMLKLQFKLHNEHLCKLNSIVTSIDADSRARVPTLRSFCYTPFDLDNLAQLKVLLVTNSKADQELVQMCLVGHFNLQAVNQLLLALDPRNDKWQQEAIRLKKFYDQLRANLPLTDNKISSEIERVTLKLETFLNALMIFIFVERHD